MLRNTQVDNIDLDMLSLSIELLEENGPRPSFADLCRCLVDMFDDKYTAVEIKECILKYKIETKTKPTKPSKKTEVARGLARWHIHTPSGPCPHPLTGVDTETISKWIDDLRVFYMRANGFLQYEAIKYFLGRFYEPSSWQYKTALTTIKDICDVD